MLGERAPMRDHRDGSDAVRAVEKRIYHSCHIEDFKCPREDRERFRVFGLCRALLNKTPFQASSGALIREEQPYGPGANDQNIRICRDICHDSILQAVPARGKPVTIYGAEQIRRPSLCFD